MEKAGTMGKDCDYVLVITSEHTHRNHYNLFD
jgi:hypothetical protein